MNILHIVHDEKFIRFVVNHLQAHSQATNKFVAIVGNSNAPLNHIAEVPVWRIVDKSYITSPKMKEDLLWCDALVIHYMGQLEARLVLTAPSNITIVWSGWGGDYYPLLERVIPPLLGVETKQLVYEISQQQQKNNNNFLLNAKRVLSRLRKTLVYDRIFIKAIKRVDLFSSPIPDDYELLKLALGIHFRAAYIQLNYGSVEQSFMTGSDNIIGQNILVGNSATAENNHIEAFKLLSHYGLADRKVIVPLSYGDTKYRDAIICYGKELLGDNFFPLVEFNTLDKYNAIISSCSIVIMNQKRQQALGNIGTLLYIGAKVFFDKDSVSFQFFKNRGAHVFSLELFEKKSANVFEPLNNTQQQQNRSIIQAFWADKVVSSNYLKLINELYKRKI